MIQITRIKNGIKNIVELPSFSRLSCLKNEGVKESQLIINDPEDEDNTWDITHHRDDDKGNIVVTIVDPNGDEIEYVGPLTNWVG